MLREECAEMSLVLFRLWRDSAGAALIEYSYLIGIIIALVVIGVAQAGSWASGTWVRLLSDLGP
jgi:Flp pilus assembly pilin Flp